MNKAPAEPQQADLLAGHDLDDLLTSQTRQALAEIAALRSPASAEIAPRIAPLVAFLFGEVIPALQGQLLLLPTFLEPTSESDEIRDGLCNARGQLGLRAEQLSQIAVSRSAATSSALRSVLSAIAKTLDALLTVQLGAVTALRCTPTADLGALQGRLGEVAEGARDQILVVDPPAYLPTEAHVLRHNPRSPKVRRLSEGRNEGGS